MSPIAEAIAHTAPTFTGQLLLHTEPGHEARRRVHNGLIDQWLEDAVSDRLERRCHPDRGNIHVMHAIQ
jgi:hypothetical protein